MENFIQKRKWSSGYTELQTLDILAAHACVTLIKNILREK